MFNSCKAFYRVRLSTLADPYLERKGGGVYRKERDSRERDETL